MIGNAYIALTTGPNIGQARPCIVTHEGKDGLLSVNVAVAKSDLINNTGWLVLDKVRPQAIGQTPEEAAENGRKLAAQIKSEIEQAHKAAQKEASDAAAAVAKAKRQIELAEERQAKAEAEEAKAEQEAAAHAKREAEEKKRLDEANKKLRTFKELQPA